MLDTLDQTALLGTGHAARRLGVSRQCVRDLRARGALVGAQVAGRFLYARDEVDRLVREREAARADRAERGHRDPGRPRAASSEEPA